MKEIAKNAHKLLQNGTFQGNVKNKLTDIDSFTLYLMFRTEHCEVH